MLTEGLIVIHYMGDTRNPEDRKFNIYFTLRETRKQNLRQAFEDKDCNLVHLIDFTVDDVTGELKQTNLETLKRDLKDPIFINPKKEKVGLDY